MAYLSSRGWLGIGVGVVLIAMIGGVVWMMRGAQPTPPQEVLSSRSPEQLRADWREGVDEALREYDATQNAARAKQMLLSLRVPADARERHLALVSAFEALSQGAAQGPARLEQARAGYR
jgi:hypothetical protein